MELLGYKRSLSVAHHSPEFLSQAVLCFQTLLCDAQRLTEIPFIVIVVLMFNNSKEGNRPFQHAWHSES
jgi:hypothetical protein